MYLKIIYLVGYYVMIYNCKQLSLRVIEYQKLIRMLLLPDN